MDLRTNTSNAAESTLSSSLAAGATTIDVADTSAFSAVPFYATIEAGNDSNREIVLVDSGKTATTFTLTSPSSRGQDGTSDVAHPSGASIKEVPVAAHINDLHDRVDNAGVDDHGALSGLADDDHTQYALADGTRGDFAATGHDHDAAYVDEPAGIDTSTGLVAGDGAGGTELVGRDTYYTTAEADMAIDNATGDLVPLDASEFAVPLYVTRSGKDSEGVFTVVEWHRSSDDTLAVKSTLSGGTSPEYTTRTVEEYQADGTTVARTTTYSLSYDSDGDFTGETTA